MGSSSWASYYGNPIRCNCDFSVALINYILVLQPKLGGRTPDDKSLVAGMVAVVSPETPRSDFTQMDRITRHGSPGKGGLTGDCNRIEEPAAGVFGDGRGKCGAESHHIGLGITIVVVVALGRRRRRRRRRREGEGGVLEPEEEPGEEGEEQEEERDGLRLLEERYLLLVVVAALQAPPCGHV